MVYHRALDQLRERLLAYCGFQAEHRPAVLMAPSGTDLFMLAAHLRQPQCTVLIDPTETGSGVPLALLGPRQGAPHSVAVRHADGGLRDAAEVDAEYAAIVNAAAGRGERVLLVLTDVSKTALIAPGIACVMALRARWPDQLDVLVDACQFRIDPATARAYLAQGFMLALTGSKFIGGPTFSGALLLPRAMAADTAAGNINFGMLLRWQAALTEMARYAAVPQTARVRWASEFGNAVRAAIDNASAGCGAHQLMPVPPLNRAALGITSGWDVLQTIFPFTLRAPNGRLLNAAEARAVYLQLQQPAPGQRRFHLGQPAGNALRLCLSARMIADLHEGTQADVATDIAAALQRISLSCAAY